MNLKKILLGTLVVALFAGSLASVTKAAGLNDPEFNSALARAYGNGLTKYDTVDAFNPYATLTREQFAKFAASFGVTNLCLEADETASCTFSDLPADPSLEDYVLLACQLGLVKGSDGKYYPTNEITKAEVITILMRALNAAAGKDAPSEAGNPWWSDAWAQAKEAGITKETDVNSLNRPLTRYEALLMLDRSRQDNAECANTDVEGLLNELFGDNTTTGDTTDDVVVTESNGTAMAKLSPATPNGATVPAGVSLKVASFDVTASDEDVTLTQVVLKRIGLGDNKAIKNLTLFVNGEVVTKSRTLNSDFEATFSTFNTPVVIKKGQTVTIDVIATVGGISEQNKEFAIQLVDFDTNGKETKSSLPATANTFRVGSVAGATVTVKRDGTVSNPNLGSKGAELVKIQLDNDSDEDIEVTQITIKDEMRNADNFANFELKNDGVTIASVASSNDRYVTFNFSSPLKISKKQSEDLRVFADVVKGAADTSKFTIDTETYVQGKGTQYGYGIAVNVADYLLLPPSDPQTITILAGEVTLSENVLPARKVRQNQKDVVLADYNLVVNAGKDLTLEDIKFVLNQTNGALATGTWADIFEDVEMQVWIDGVKKTFDLIADASSASSATYNDTQMAIALPAGAKIQIKLVGDTKTTISTLNSGRKFAVTLNIANNLKLIENSDDRVVTDKTPSTITSNTIEIVESKFTVTRLNRGDVNSVRGSTNIDALAFQVKADDVSDIFVTDIKVQGAYQGTGVFASSGVSAVKLWSSDSDGTGGWTLLETQGGTKIVDGVLSFDKFLDVKVLKGGTKNFLVTVDIVNDANLQGKTIEVYIPALGVVASDDNNRNLSSQPSSVSGKGRTITITSVGTLASQVDNANEKTPRARNVVAGTTSDYVATFRLTAQNEPIIVEDFRINVTGGTGFTSAVQKVEIYNAAGSKVASQDVTGTPVVFDNANLKVALGTNDFFVKLVTNNIGQNFDGLVMSDASLSFEALVARGEQSGVDTNLPLTSGSNNVQIIPVHISVVKITGGAGALTNGYNELGVIEITANTWNNTKLDGSVLDLVLSTLKINLGSTKASSGTITRLDISPTDPICNILPAGTVDFTTCTAGVANIKSAQTARYRVDAFFTGVVTNDSAQLTIDSLAGGDITYTSTEGGFSVTDLRLGDPDVKGTKKVAN